MGILTSICWCPLSLNSGEKKHSVEAAVGPHLIHLLILGTNWPAFKALVMKTLWDGSCSSKAWVGSSAALIAFEIIGLDLIGLNKGITFY